MYHIIYDRESKPKDESKAIGKCLGSYWRQEKKRVRRKRCSGKGEGVLLTNSHADPVYIQSGYPNPSTFPESNPLLRAI